MKTGYFKYSIDFLKLNFFYIKTCVANQSSSFTSKDALKVCCLYMFVA